MNLKNITIYRIPTESDAWYRFRTSGLTPEDVIKYNCPQYAGGLGASEIGNILGLQKKYRPCRPEVYHIKAGDLQYEQDANRAMVRGKILEPIVSKIWTVFDGESESWVDSIMDYMYGSRELKSQLSVRNCRGMSGYFVNNNYPYLFSSLDYFADKNTPGILDGKIHKNGFPVECKTINSNYAKLWVNDIPPYHLAQINQEMICTNSDYGEIACLFPDEFRFKVYGFYRDDKICNDIITMGKEFWDRVMSARESIELKKQFLFEGDRNKAAEMQAIIDSNEPAIDDGEACNEWLKEQFRDGARPSINGDISLYNLANTYQMCTALEALIDQKKTGIQNIFLQKMIQEGVTEIVFDEAGKVTCNKNAKGSYVFRCGTKSIAVDPKVIAENEFKKITFNVL